MPRPRQNRRLTLSNPGGALHKARPDLSTAKSGGTVEKRQPAGIRSNRPGAVLNPVRQGPWAGRTAEKARLGPPVWQFPRIGYLGS